MSNCPSLLRCPVCGGQLTVQDATFRCPQGHAFDVAREGYVNLRLARGSPPQILGDAAEMLRARRRFLERDHYLPLTLSLNQRAVNHLQAHPDNAGAIRVLDVGCGEGYYLGHLQHYLQRRFPDRPCCAFGMDLAKEAVRLAARRYHDVQFFVADVRQRLLFPDGAIDLLLNVFAPRNPDEFDRVLATDGILLVVIPAADHLAGLRRSLSLLDIEEGKEEKLVAQLGAAFRLRHRHALQYELSLDSNSLADLVQMTPNYWHLPSANRQALQQQDGRSVRASFVILEFGR